MDQPPRPRGVRSRVSEQLVGRLPAKTGESREQRGARRLGEVPHGAPTLRQPHHEATVRVPATWTTMNTNDYTITNLCICYVGIYGL